MSGDSAALLLSRHEQLPPRASAAAKVMHLVDDPDASVQQIAQAISPDPIFAAKILRVANSAYYGLGGRVGTLPFAVSVLGFQTVRSLAVAAAAGLDDAGAAPAGFWEAAVGVATAAEMLAPLMAAHPGDSFSVGLLHMLGAAFLHQASPLPRICLPDDGDGAALCAQEEAEYGIDHARAGARVLSAWRFPPQMCALIGRHHEAPLPDAAPLERVLHAARRVSGFLLAGTPDALLDDPELPWLAEGRLTRDDLPVMIDRIARKSEALLEGLRPGY
ncbi:MAG: HDOD domain-containing protein [Kineosporiaceae bacterium]